MKVQTNDESNEEEEGFNLEIKLIDRTQTLNAYQIKKVAATRWKTMMK